MYLNVVSCGIQDLLWKQRKVFFSTLPESEVLALLKHAFRFSPGLTGNLLFKDRWVRAFLLSKLLICSQNRPAWGCNLHPKLTHVQLSLQRVIAAEDRSDRRGVTKCNQAMAFPGRGADPGDNPKNRTQS
jgi:hypothetical protein